MDNRPGQTMQRAVLTAAAASASLAGACFGQGIPCLYEVLATIQGPTCGILATITTATAINNHGTVVGHYRCQAGNPRPFVWTETNGFQFVPLPPWLLEASPADVNDNNIMVGTGVGPVAGQRGFVCDLNTGAWTELLPQNPPIGWSGATGINNSNVVCGFRSIDDGGDPVNPQTAFIWSAKDGFTDLGLIDGMTNGASAIANDGIVAVGASFGLHAFTWDGRTTTPIGMLPGADSVSPHGIANDQHVAGSSLFISGTLFWSVPWEVRNGVLEALPVLPAPNTSCTALEVANTCLISGVPGQPSRISTAMGSSILSICSSSLITGHPEKEVHHDLSAVFVAGQTWNQV